MPNCEIAEPTKTWPYVVQCQREGTVARAWYDPDPRMVGHIVRKTICISHAEELDKEISNGTLSSA